MVFFTCNHCGESLKKPAVDKHYTFKSCRGAPFFLTCVDCLKDFHGDEFRAHTSCVSELERYSAKGFVAKAPKNKGAHKQETWTEIIQNHLSECHNMDKRIAEMMQRISNQTNVPRKKAKFINFIKNSMRIDPNTAEKCWAVIEMALENFNKKVEAARAEKAAAVEKRKLEEVAEQSQKDADDDEAPKKKKKRNNSQGEDSEKLSSETKKKDKKQNGVQSNGNGVANEEEQDVSTKKKKKNKNKIETEDIISTNGAAEETNGTPKTDENFSWTDVITKVLTRKTEMDMESLQEKVFKKLAKYKNEIGTKDEKKLRKTLKKMNTVSIEGTIVKLIA